MAYKVLVIGEKCLDRFVYGECLRLSPEAPVPVFRPIYETTNLGMAANVVANLVSSDFNNTILKSDFGDNNTGAVPEIITGLFSTSSPEQDIASTLMKAIKILFRFFIFIIFKIWLVSCILF